MQKAGSVPVMLSQACSEVCGAYLRGDPSSSWPACIKQIYELDPLECPKCKAPMRILAFVQDPAEIKKIIKSLGLPDSTAPPPLPNCSNPIAALKGSSSTA